FHVTAVQTCALPISFGTETGEMAATANIARGLLVTLIAWQAAIWVLAPPHYMMPSPQAVGAVFAGSSGLLLFHLAITITEVLAGLAIRTACAIGGAPRVVAVPRFGSVVWPIVLVLQALPVFAIAPLLVLWFGFGMASKVVMATLIIFFPIASAFADGLRRTPQDLLDATALTEATRLQTL